MNTADIYTPGTSWLWHLPPGWEITGTVRELITIDGREWLVVDDGAYIESVSAGVHTLCAATTPAELREIVTLAHPIPDGMLIAASTPTHAVPMALPSRILSRAGAADTIRDAGR